MQMVFVTSAVQTLTINEKEKRSWKRGELGNRRQRNAEEEFLTVPVTLSSLLTLVV
jgi:hypothetical protein